MRKWRFTRPAASPAATAAAALLTAVAVHALFLLPQYRTPTSRTTLSSSGIQMLTTGSFSAEKQKDFQKWLAIHDPARAARSSSGSGYSSVQTGNKQISVRIEPYRVAEIRNQVHLTAFSPVPAGRNVVKSMPDNVIQKPAAAPLRKALVFDGDGNRIEMPQIIPAHLGSSRPTVISVTGFGKVSGIVVSRSCGSRELDLMALASAAKMDLKERAALTFIWPGKEKK